MTTEEKIINQTVHLIDTNGYQNLSLRKLTKELGLTTGAFYRHFKDKNELFQKVVIQLSKRFIEQIPLNEDYSSKQQLLIIAKYICQSITMHPNQMDFLFYQLSALDLYSNANQYSFLQKVKALITNLNSSTTLSDQDLFIQIWSFIQGYALLIKNKITHYDAQLVEYTLDQLLKGKD